MLLEMARLITIQQTEIDRLRSMIPCHKKSKKKIDKEDKERRVSLILKMYQKQWEKVLHENSDHIANLNQQLSSAELTIFTPNFEIELLLKAFK